MRFLVEENKIENREIKKIIIKQPSYFAENFIAYPPVTSIDTASSLKYLVGAFLLTRAVSVKWYEEYEEILENNEFIDIASKIEIVKDDDLQDLFNKKNVVKGSVIIETTNATFEKDMKLEDLKGNPRNNPMTIDDVIEKFIDLSQPIIGKTQVNDFLRIINKDMFQANILELIHPLRVI